MKVSYLRREEHLSAEGCPHLYVQPRHLREYPCCPLGRCWYMEQRKRQKSGKRILTMGAWRDLVRAQREFSGEAR